MKRIHTLLLTMSMMGLVVLLASCGGPSGGDVATVGSESISAETLQDDLLRAYQIPAQARKQTLEARLQVLENMIVSRMKKQEAAARGLREEPEMQDKEQEFLEAEAINRLYRVEILERIAGEAQIAEYYENDQKEVKGSHILLKWPADATAEDSAEVRLRAEEIHQLVVGGGDFAVLAAEHTEEPGGKERGGSLDWFGWGRMVEEFQQRAWRMKPGEISEPLETQFGIHIIKVEDTREKQLPPLKDMEKDIERMIMQRGRDKTREMVETYFTGMREEFQLVFTNRIDTVLTLINSTDRGANPFTGLDSTVMDWVICTTTAENFTVRDLEAKVNENPRAGADFPNREALEDLIDGAAIPVLLGERAKQQGLLADPEVIERAELAMGMELDRRLTSMEIDDKVDLSDETLRAYFNQHAEEFMTKPTVEVQEIFVADQQLAKDLAVRAQGGENFARLAKKYTERSSAKDNDGILPPFPPGRYGDMGKAAFTLEVGEIAGPIVVGSKHSVIKLLKKTEARAQTFEEAEPAVRSTVEQQQRAAAQTALMEMLYEKYPVVVDTERVRTLFM